MADMRDLIFNGPSEGSYVSSSNNSEMLDWFQINSGLNDEIVTSKQAMRIATVYRCVVLIAGAVSGFPRQTYDENHTRLTRDRLWYLLNEEPSSAWTGASWMQSMAATVLLRGDSFTEIVRDADGVKAKELRPIHRSNVQILKLRNNDLAYRINDSSGKSKVVLSVDMLHFSGYGFDGEKSMPVIEYAARSGINNSEMAARNAAQTFKGGAMPQLALEMPRALETKQADALRASFAATYSRVGSNKVPLVLTEGASVKEISLTPESAQLLESRHFERQEICIAFGVNPVLIGDSEKSTSFGSGIEHLNLGFVQYTLKPLILPWEQELNRKLMTGNDRIKFNLDSLMRGDSNARGNYFKAALGGPGSGPGWMTQDEVRALDNFPPIAGGDKIYYPESGNEKKLSVAAA